jgi:hypothetical protein
MKSSLSMLSDNVYVELMYFSEDILVVISGSSNDYSWTVWFQLSNCQNILLAQWFRRRSLKCEKFTDDGHQVMAIVHLDQRSRWTTKLITISEDHANGHQQRYSAYQGHYQNTHFFLFIFWWHQIFSFPFCFSLLVFPTLQWHILIICSREKHHEK